MSNTEKKLTLDEFIDDMLKNESFVSMVTKSVNSLYSGFRNRPIPKAGYRHNRSVYYQLDEANQLNPKFFLDNIKSIWLKKSTLSSNKRKLIQYVCDNAVSQLFKIEQVDEAKQ